MPYTGLVMVIFAMVVMMVDILQPQRPRPHGRSRPRTCRVLVTAGGSIGCSPTVSDFRVCTAFDPFILGINFIVLVAVGRYPAQVKYIPNINQQIWRSHPC
jgi:hypothetical protein